ncbi:MAG: GNAT family N-acetyltransferase [Flavobacteriales bacterium]|nr:GNAT family N-acetyltransferase [Flavobacteriales bacterium]
MIVHLRHHDIDPVAWDQRLEACSNASWYGLSSTLEAAAPGGWDALVDETTGEQMPLFWRRKYGVSYLYQPFMIQHSGPYSLVDATAAAARFLRALPMHFRYADINLLASGITGIAHLRTEQRTNHVLQLNRSADTLRSGYSTNHRRSLRRAAGADVTVERDVSGQRVLEVIEGSEQFIRWRVDAAARATMRRLVQATEADGTGWGRMVTSNGEPVAIAWFVRSHERIIFLKGIGTARGRELRAMHLLIDDVIAEHASSGTAFDLAGGNDPQLARFYSGFGAEPVVYLRTLMNRLPPLIRLIKS